MLKGAGCLLLISVLGALALEVYLFLVVVQRAEDVVLPLVAVMATSFIGIRLTIAYGKLLPMEFMAGKAGRRIIGIMGALLLAFPGFGSDLLALPLLFPPVQALLGRFGTVLAGSLMRNAMGRMGGKFPGGGGFPGGFPGGGGPFPGMQPRGGFAGMKPDDSVATKRGGPKRIIDTTVDKS